MSEITVAIPSYNAVMYLPYIFSRLQHQKIPNLPVILMDQGSRDGTQGWASSVMGNNFYAKKSQEKNALNFSFFQRQQDPKSHPYVNAMAARQGIAKLVKTKYVFFLDPDVLIKPLVLPRLIDEMENTGAPYMGLKYEPDALDAHPSGLKHIMLGATLWKTEKFLKVPEFTHNELKKGCDCNHCFRNTKGGLHSRINGAEHLKGVMI